MIKYIIYSLRLKMFKANLRQLKENTVGINCRQNTRKKLSFIDVKIVAIGKRMFTSNCFNIKQLSIVEA